VSPGPFACHDEECKPYPMLDIEPWPLVLLNYLPRLLCEC